MKRFIYIAVLINLFIPTFLFAQTDTEAIKKEVIALDEKRGQAIRNKDMPFLYDLYSDDWVYISPWGTMTNKEPYLEHIKNVTYEKLNYEYIQARVYADGHAVILTLKNTVKAQTELGPVDGVYLYTRIYVKEKDKWLFVSQHGTKMGNYPPSQQKSKKDKK